MKKKNKLTNISLKELEKLEKENPQADIVRIPKKQICEDCGKATSKGKMIMFTDRYLDETYELWFCEECAKKYKGKNI
ncbi:MAG: hypothetical protein ACTSQE_06980 [Candidatus Heimdallarchaeaceae archaeon]